jgi:hypothetical protein
LLRNPDVGAQKFVKAVYLPLFINKFFTPTDMSSQEFFDRWKKLSQPIQESQKIFAAQQDIDTEQIRAKVSVFEIVSIKFIPFLTPNFSWTVSAPKSLTMWTPIQKILSVPALFKRKTLRSALLSVWSPTNKRRCSV